MSRKYLVLWMLFQFIQHGSFCQDLNDFESQVNTLIADGELPSLAIGVLKDGKVIYKNAFGYADVSLRTKSTVDTPYQLASLTKPITATAIMTLHQQGIIDLDDPITKYMALKKVDTTFNNPTIRQVLNHTAGLGTYFDIYYDDERVRPITFEEAWEQYGILYMAPGKISEYSNLGYGLLDHIISSSALIKYSQYIQNNIFDKLKMEDSFVVERDGVENRKLARKYGPNLETLPFVWNNTVGAGNVASSINDLMKFASFHLQNHKTDVLESENLNIMQAYREPNALFHYYEDTYYGLGWYVRENDNGQKVVWHEGGMMGASTVLKLYPKENLAIAIVTNTYTPQICRNLTDKVVSQFIKDHLPTPLNEVTEYSDVSTDPKFKGLWAGSISIQDIEVPISLSITEDGTEMSYLDFTFNSFLTDYQPLPYTTKLLLNVTNQDYFLGTGIGMMPATDVRKDTRHILSLKLFREGITLKGTIVNLAAAKREYYARPYYIELQKKVE